MPVSKSSIAYEIPSHFQAPLKKQTLEEKIWGIVKKLIAFLNRNQFAITISFFSFLVSKSIATSLEDLSSESTAIDPLKDCQDRICAYWNSTMQNEEVIESSKNLLANLQSRCDPFHSHYKPFASVKKCMKVWCKYANKEGETLPECVDPLQKLIEAWNRFCPKREFNRLRRTRKIFYMNHCIRKFCNSYKERKDKSTYYFFCSSLEINSTIEKLYNFLKKWKEEHNEKELINKNLETSLSITSSALGIISAGISITATLIGCCVAKITLSSFPDVSQGLRNIVDTTLLYARQATATPPDSLAVAEAERQISQISSDINNVYHDVSSSISSLDRNNLEELHFDFGYQETVKAEESSLSANILQESIRAEEIQDTELFLESSLFSQGMVHKFIEMTKNSTEFIDLHNSSFLQNSTDLYETIGAIIEGGIVNLTQVLSENYTQIIEQDEDLNFLDNTTFTSNTTENFFVFPENYTVSSSTVPTEKPLWRILLESYVKPMG